MTIAAAPTTLARRARSLRVGPLHGGGLWGVLAMVIIYLALSVPRFADPYVIDEAVFPYVAQGILQHGAPIYYNGELRPADVGLWHPPLYDYLLAGFVGIFGFSPFAVRAFGTVCVLLAVFVLTFALRRIAPRTSQAGYVALAALVLLNPLVISGALIPDIDGTLGFLVVALGLWLAMAVKQAPLSLRLGLLISGYAVLAVATKFTISGFVALIIVVAALLSRSQRWTKALVVVGGFAVGTLVALALLFAAGALIGFDARLPFDYLFGSLGSRAPGRGGLAGAISSFADGPGSTLVWIGPAIMIAAIVAAIVIALRRPQGVDASLVALSAGAGLVIVVGYAIITASPFQFPKYTPIAVPAFALATATLLMLVPGRILVGLRRPRAILIIVGYFLVLLIGTIGMFALAARNERHHGRTLIDLVVLSAAAFVAVLIVTAIALALLRPRREGDRRVSMIHVVGSATLVALVVTPVMTQTSTAMVNVTVPYSTRYYYGERGMEDFMTQAAQIIPPGSKVIAPKDVGFQLHRRFYEDALLFATPVADYRKFLETKQVPYLVTRRLHDYSEPVYPDHFKVIRELYTPVLDNPAQDFVLWKLKDS